MNEIVNRFLLARDKRMPKMNLRQPGYTHSVCDLFTRNKKRIHKFLETRVSGYIY